MSFDQGRNLSMFNGSQAEPTGLVFHVEDLDEDQREGSKIVETDASEQIHIEEMNPKEQEQLLIQSQDDLRRQSSAARTIADGGRFVGKQMLKPVHAIRDAAKLRKLKELGRKKQAKLVAENRKR